MIKISVKFYYLFLFLFLINIVHSQATTVKVTYKTFPSSAPLEDNEIIKKSKRKHIYEGLDNALASLQHCLVANKQQSHFYLEDGLAINDRAKRLAIAFTEKNNIFINLSSKLYVKKKNIFRNEYFVSWDLEPKWKLIDEKKMIDGYLCFKAITDKVIRINKTTDKIIPVTAWYCPTIPFSFGPKEYFNLPGLILELQEEKVTFLATKISFNVEIKDLVLDRNTTIINQEEFNIKFDLQTKEFFEKIGKKYE